jgi:translation initiation factor 2 gamma subunit (eIF-2gamma)
MLIVRSFDVNKPGPIKSSVSPISLRGAVLGGTVMRGRLEVGAVLELRPGLLRKVPLLNATTASPDSTGAGGDGEFTGAFKTVCTPLLTVVEGLRSDSSAQTTDLHAAIPGGLIAVQTSLDPCLGRADAFVGQLVGYPGQLPPVFEQLQIDYTPLRLDQGARESSEKRHSKKERTRKLKNGERVKVHVGSGSVLAVVTGTRTRRTDGEEGTATDTRARVEVRLQLLEPVCVALNAAVSVSTLRSAQSQKKAADKDSALADGWRLTGFGTVLDGKEVELDTAQLVDDTSSLSCASAPEVAPAQNALLPVPLDPARGRCWSLPPARLCLLARALLQSRRDSSSHSNCTLCTSGPSAPSAATEASAAAPDRA